MSWETAIQKIKNTGSLVDRARVDYLLEGQPPSEQALAALTASQRADGGWAPHWMQDYSSVDATCFYLSQGVQMGLKPTSSDIARGLQFLADRQRPDGSWEEDAEVGQTAPPWAKPGDLSAALYLTANCGYWLASTSKYSLQARQALRFLLDHTSSADQLPSYIHTAWLGIGLLYRLGVPEQASHWIDLLASGVGRLSASELAWMLVTLRVVGVGSHYPLMETAADRLAQLQQSDGGWASDDGPGFDSHLTVEALFALLPGPQTLQWFNHFLPAIVRWAAARSDLHAVALAGSYARGAARFTSDVDLVILASDPHRYIEQMEWVEKFGEAQSIAVEDYGKVTSVRVYFAGGMEVEFGWTTPDWAALPLDPGTRRVIEDGINILYDPDHLFPI